MSIEKPKPIDPIAKALYHSLESPNEFDSNGETANVVDGLFAITRSIRYLADKIDKKETVPTLRTVSKGEPGYDDGVPF